MGSPAKRRLSKENYKADTHKTEMKRENNKSVCPFGTYHDPQPVIGVRVWQSGSRGMFTELRTSEA